jgi:NAD(P)H-dependent FMN reductase
MPDDPRLTIPVLLGTIPAGRRSAHVVRLLLGQLEGPDEVATALIDLADLDLPVMRRCLGETDAAPRGAIGLNEKLSRADGLVVVAPEYKNGCPGSLKIERLAVISVVAMQVALPLSAVQAASEAARAMCLQPVADRPGNA